MRRRSVSALLLAALLAATAGCNRNASTPTSASTGTTTTSGTIVVETFSGVLNRSGGITHTFVTNSFGSVQLLLLALERQYEPVEGAEAPTIGISLGTWNGTSCSAVIAQDRATVSASVLGTANAAGMFCLRAYDANGSLAGPTAYTIQVSHP